MRQVNIGTIERQTYESGNVAGINLTAHLIHAANNTAFSGMPLDWSQVILTVELTKASGAKHTICQDPVLALAMASGFKNSLFRQTTTVGTPEQVIYVAHGASNPAILKQSVRVVFPVVVNIRKGDKMRVELNVTAGSVSSTVVNTVTSLIYFDIEEGIGNSFSLPKYQVEVLKQNEQTMIAAANGVIAAHFINNDKSGINSTNQVVQTASVSSTLVDRVSQYDELLSRRYKIFEATAEADARNQCFCFFDAYEEKQTLADVRADNFKAVISLNSNNVNSNKNWVVLTRLVNDTDVLSVAIEKENEHAERNKLQYVN